MRIALLRIALLRISRRALWVLGLLNASRLSGRTLYDNVRAKLLVRRSRLSDYDVSWGSTIAWTASTATASNDRHDDPDEDENGDDNGCHNSTSNLVNYGASGIRTVACIVLTTMPVEGAVIISVTARCDFKNTKKDQKNKEMKLRHFPSRTMSFSVHSMSVFRLCCLRMFCFMPTC